MNLNCELNGNFIKKNAHWGIYATERAPELEMVNEQQPFGNGSVAVE